MRACRLEGSHRASGEGKRLDPTADGSGDALEDRLRRRMVSRHHDVNAYLATGCDTRAEIFGKQQKSFDLAVLDGIHRLLPGPLVDRPSGSGQPCRNLTQDAMLLVGDNGEAGRRFGGPAVFDGVAEGKGEQDREEEGEDQAESIPPEYLRVLRRQNEGMPEKRGHC